LVIKDFFYVCGRWFGRRVDHNDRHMAMSVNKPGEEKTIRNWLPKSKCLVEWWVNEQGDT